MDRAFSLDGKTFLIAGGTRGIGRAISLQFARAGARVVANYVRDEQAAQALLAEAAREALGLTVCRADLASAKGLAKLDQEVATVSTDLSGLVFCAATGVHRPLEGLTGRHFDWTFSLNVRAFFDLVTLLLPRFRGSASIVALSSQGARQVVPSYSLVGASKAALESLARHMAVELAPQKVRSNCICPVVANTPMGERFLKSAMKLYGMDAGGAFDFEGAKQFAATTIPLQMLSEPDDIAYAAVYLASDESRLVTGTYITVDGGSRAA